MATRFTDDLTNHPESDFIVRRRRPLAIQLFFIFAVAFLTIYLTARIMGDTQNPLLFFLTLAALIGALGWFTIFFISRHRDLVLATEFQNAMLASAAQLSTRFCAITRRDGSIVYVDSGFQALFPDFSGMGRIDAVLESAGIDGTTVRAVLGLLEEEQNGRAVLPLADAQGGPRPMMVTVEALPRPRGYFLLRGRDYVAQRKGQDGAPDVDPLLLARALDDAAGALLVANATGEVAHLTPALAFELGYDREVPSALTLSQVFQYPDGRADEAALADFIGEVSLKRRGGGLITRSIRQRALVEGGRALGAVAVVDLGDRGRR